MENANNPQVIVWWGEKDKRGIVYSNRNRIIDQMVDEIVQAKFLIGVQSDANFNEFIEHCETMRRVKEVNLRGIERFVWESTSGKNHYFMAMLYYYLAKLSLGSGAVFSGDNQERAELIKETSDGPVLNLGEVMEER